MSSDIRRVQHYYKGSKETDSSSSKKSSSSSSKRPETDSNKKNTSSSTSNSKTSSLSSSYHKSSSASLKSSLTKAATSLSSRRSRSRSKSPKNKKSTSSRRTPSRSPSPFHSKHKTSSHHSARTTHRGRSRSSHSKSPQSSPVKSSSKLKASNKSSTVTSKSSKISPPPKKNDKSDKKSSNSKQIESSKSHKSSKTRKSSSSPTANNHTTSPAHSPPRSPTLFYRSPSPAPVQPATNVDKKVAKKPTSPSNKSAGGIKSDRSNKSRSVKGHRRSTSRHSSAGSYRSRSSSRSSYKHKQSSKKGGKQRRSRSHSGHRSGSYSDSENGNKPHNMPYYHHHHAPMPYDYRYSKPGGHMPHPPPMSGYYHQMAPGDGFRNKFYPPMAGGGSVPGNMPPYSKFGKYPPNKRYGYGPPAGYSGSYAPPPPYGAPRFPGSDGMRFNTNYRYQGPGRDYYGQGGAYGGNKYPGGAGGGQPKAIENKEEDEESDSSSTGEITTTNSVSTATIITIDPELEDAVKDITASIAEAASTGKEIVLSKEQQETLQKHQELLQKQQLQKQKLLQEQQHAALQAANAKKLPNYRLLGRNIFEPNFNQQFAGKKKMVKTNTYYSRYIKQHPVNTLPLAFQKSMGVIDDQMPAGDEELQQQAPLASGGKKKKKKKHSSGSSSSSSSSRSSSHSGSSRSRSSSSSSSKASQSNRSRSPSASSTASKKKVKSEKLGESEIKSGHSSRSSSTSSSLRRSSSHSSSYSSSDSTARKKKKKSGKKKTSTTNGSKKFNKELKYLNNNTAGNDSDGSMLNLNENLRPISAYIRDRQRMLNEMFRCIKGSKLNAMLPDVLKNKPLKEVKRRCLEVLEIMSKKRIRCLIADKPMDSSSGTEESSDEEELNDSLEKKTITTNNNASGADIVAAAVKPATQKFRPMGSFQTVDDHKDEGNKSNDDENSQQSESDSQPALTTTESGQTATSNNKSSDGGMSAAGFKTSIVKKSINIKIAGGAAPPANATASSSSPNTNQASSNQLTSLQKQQNSLSNKLKQSAAKLKTVESAPELTYKSTPNSMPGMPTNTGPMNQMVGQNSMNNAYAQYQGAPTALLPSNLIPPPNVGMMPPNGPALMPTPQYPPNRMPGNQYGAPQFNLPPPNHLMMQPHQVYSNGGPTTAGFMPSNLVQQQPPLLFNPYMMMQHPNGMNQQRLQGPNNNQSANRPSNDSDYDEYRMMGDDAYDLDDENDDMDPYKSSYHNQKISRHKYESYDNNYDLEIDDVDMLAESKRSKKHHKNRSHKKHKKHKKSKDLLESDEEELENGNEDQEAGQSDDLDGIKSMLKQILKSHIDMLTKAKDFELIPTLNGLLEQVVNDDSSLTHEDCVNIHQTVKSLFDGDEEGEVEQQDAEAAKTTSRKRKNKESSRSRRQKKAKDEMEAGEIDDLYDDQEAIVQKEYYDLLR